VVDLCCGSGAIAASVASARRDLAVVAADIDPTAVAMATTNLRHLGAAARVSDMDRSLPLALKGYVDLVTACPPYVPTGDIDSLPREARDHEPRLALDGGVDGTTVQREVFDAAFRLLRAGGIAVVETSEALSDATITAATEAGLEAGVEADEDIGATVVVATRR
jgi:release factor glutamine methyltransferase